MWLIIDQVSIEENTVKAEIEKLEENLRDNFGSTFCTIESSIKDKVSKYKARTDSHHTVGEMPVKIMILLWKLILLLTIIPEFHPAILLFYTVAGNEAATQEVMQMRQTCSKEPDTNRVLAATYGHGN